MLQYTKRKTPAQPAYFRTPKRNWNYSVFTKYT